MKSLLILSFALIVGVLSTTAVDAQNRSAVDHDMVRRLISIQMVESLESPLAMVRSQTLKNAIVFGTLYPGRIDLNVAVSKIADVAARDASDSNRRLAIAALRAINSYRAKQYLAELQGMPDTEYSTVIAGVLSEYHDSKAATGRL